MFVKKWDSTFHSMFYHIILHCFTMFTIGSIVILLRETQSEGLTGGAGSFDQEVPREKNNNALHITILFFDMATTEDIRHTPYTDIYIVGIYVNIHTYIYVHT